MATRRPEPGGGLLALRLLVQEAWGRDALLAVPGGSPTPDQHVGRGRHDLGLQDEASRDSGTAWRGPDGFAGSGRDPGRAASSSADEAESTRVIALVDLARGGDAEAFGQLYDRYQPGVYRFVYYRVGSAHLAEDITSETFFRALRGMASFRWQGKDFGAWLTTIARNLTTDHFKSARNRLEFASDDLSEHDRSTPGPENAVLASLSNEELLRALRTLPHEQQECLIMRFLQGLSIAETARVLGRSEGAVKQLQLRAVRALAATLSGDER